MKIQFEMSDDKVEEMQRLMDATGLATKRELFNSALTLFKWAVEQRQDGRTIGSIDEPNQLYRELEMPALNNVKKT